MVKGVFDSVVGSRRLSNALDLVKDGIQNPTSVPAYLGTKFADTKLDLKYEAYRRKNNIPRQTESIHGLVDHDQFVLVILDSCRYDSFERLYPEYLSGSLDRVWSSGNWTRKWMERTWDGTYDLTYISTTPYTFDYSHEEYNSRYRPSDHLDDVINVIGEEWNPVLSTTPPEPVTDTALRHISETETTRAVVHYMQPHAPYIGDERILQWDLPDDQINRLLEYMTKEDRDLDDSSRDETGVESGEEGVTVTELVSEDLGYEDERQLQRENYESIDSQFKRGKITSEELREAYKANLQYVLSEVQRLVSYLDCPVVVSADHGEHLGEHFDEVPQLTHPDRTHPILREVPWFTVDEEAKGHHDLSAFESRKSRSAAGENEVDEDTITNRLEALGYK